MFVEDLRGHVGDYIQVIDNPIALLIARGIFDLFAVLAVAHSRAAECDEACIRILNRVNARLASAAPRL